MGFAAQYLDFLAGYAKSHRVLFPGANVMDIGSSNILGADAGVVRRFCTQFNSQLEANPSDLNKFCDRIAKESVISPGVKTAYVGEVFKKAGLNYQSIDIYEGYDCRIFDLNRESVPAEWKGKYDLTINYGTTEHVFNQYNSFKVIHDLTKPGGFIMHQLPSLGYLDHGYFNYQPKTFDSLAEANRYQVVYIGYHEPQGFSEFNDSYKNFGNYEEWKRLKSPNGVINVLFKKTVDEPFSLQLDLSTTAGAITEDVFQAYAPKFEPGQKAPPARVPTLLSNVSGWDLQRELIRRYKSKVLRFLPESWSKPTEKRVKQSA